MENTEEISEVLRLTSPQLFWFQYREYTYELQRFLCSAFSLHSSHFFRWLILRPRFKIPSLRHDPLHFGKEKPSRYYTPSLQTELSSQVFCKQLQSRVREKFCEGIDTGVSLKEEDSSHTAQLLFKYLCRLGQQRNGMKAGPARGPRSIVRRTNKACIKYPCLARTCFVINNDNPRIVRLPHFSFLVAGRYHCFLLRLIIDKLLLSAMACIAGLEWYRILICVNPTDCSRV